MNLITLKDLRAKRLAYNWETIYVGMEMAYFTIQAISDYAVEPMEGGINDEFINQLAWGVEDEDSSRILFEIKCHFNLVSEKNNDEYKLTTPAKPDQPMTSDKSVQTITIKFVGQRLPQTNETDQQHMTLSGLLLLAMSGLLGLLGMAKRQHKE
ncbi:DUF2247 family protein [Lactiplantibacillus plantarum]|nr:DUF2247 family protein [Lactiplantibacillus plantarum]QJY42591.1 DUF2247 family protein [Lactiplantibacillus plantarum]